MQVLHRQAALEPLQQVRVAPEQGPGRRVDLGEVPVRLLPAPGRGLVEGAEGLDEGRVDLGLGGLEPPLRVQRQALFTS